jgi:hypothetical protein
MAEGPREFIVRKTRVGTSAGATGRGTGTGVGNYGSARLLASSVGRGWLASSLAARLVARDVSARATQAGLDRRRLTRVLDHIGANPEGD